MKNYQKLFSFSNELNQTLGVTLHEDNFIRYSKNVRNFC